MSIMDKYIINDPCNYMSTMEIFSSNATIRMNKKVKRKRGPKGSPSPPQEQDGG